jgi:uncharacterized repeat protein (TIGR01451 family)
MRTCLALLATAFLGVFGLTSADAVVVTYTDPAAAAVPDNGCLDDTNGTGLGGVSRSITIPAGDAGSILDVNVRINATHTWRSDVQAALTDGTTTVILANNHDGSGDNYRALFDTAAPAACSVNSATTCGATNTTGACATTEATCQPNQSLNAFNGLESSNRTFTLQICDRAAADLGTLNSWELIVDRNAVVGGSADVSITKTDGVTSVVAGTSTTYTIVASNAGPNAAPSNLVVDTFPAACSSVAWTCGGAGGGTCTASGSGNISDNTNLPVGASVTYTAICNIDVAATGTLANTATVTVGGGVTDPTPGNNSATDSNTLLTPPNADVSPLSLSATIPVNQTTTAPLTIGNTGQGDLIWNIAEEPVARPPSPPLPSAPGNPGLAAETATNSSSKPDPSGPAARSNWRAPQALLFDNGPLITIAGGGAGGLDLSELQTALGANILGFGHQLGAGNRVADDFTVTGGGWLISNVTFFAYQTGSPTTSTMTAVTLQIWDGVPGAPGSNIVFGDTVTNRLVSSAFTNIYRATDTAPTGSTRPIMANTVAVNTYLPAGTYWLDWSAAGSLASGPWAPPVTLAGQTGKPGANGLQFTGTWGPLIDTPNTNAPQDLPFLIDGLDQCVSPANVPWLSVAPTMGTTTGGGSTPVTVSFDATGLAAGTYNARLCVTSNDPTPAPTGNGTSIVPVPVTFTVTPEADLAITLTDAPDPATAGTNLTYTATVTNGGPSPADNVSITLPLPAGTSFVSATPSAGGTCNAASPVVCSWVGPIASAGVVSATIVAAIAPATTGVLSATATAATTTPDPAAGNDTATATTSVDVSADLSITLTDTPDPVTAGTNLVYTATVTNAGPSDAVGVTVTMAVPANTTFVSGTTTGGGSCAGSPIVCTFPTNFAPTTSQTATITVAVSASAPNGSSISATATAGSASADPNGANNSASVSTLVAADANLQLTLSASSLAVLTNEPVTFTAVSLNLGPSDAQNLSITMTLTPDFRYTAHTATGATCTTPQVGNSGVVTCTWAGATAVNASRTLQVVAYSNNQGATAVNASTVSDTSDPVTTNNVGNVSVQVGFPVEEIPTLSQYGLILLGLMLGLLGFVAVRRQS